MHKAIPLLAIWALLLAACDDKPSKPSGSRKLDPAVEEARKRARAARAKRHRPREPPAVPTPTRDMNGPKDATKKGTTTTAKGEPDTLPQGVTRVKLLSKGTAPWERLRYKFAVGKAEKLRARVTLKQWEKKSTRWKPLEPLPTLSFQVTVKAESPTPNGVNRRYKTTKAVIASKGRASAKKVRLFKHQLRLGTFNLWQTVTHRGTVTDYGISRQPRLQSDYSRMLSLLLLASQRMTPGLPTEPVGVGAKWLVNTRIKSSMHTRAPRLLLQYTLKKRTGKRLRLQAALTSPFPGKQRLMVPSLQPGYIATLTRSTDTGRVSVSAELDRLVSNVELSARSEFSIRFTNDTGFDETRTRRLEFKVTIRRVDKR